LAKTKTDDTRELPSLLLPEEDFETPADDYAPEGFDTVEDYLKDMRETYALDLEADDENRKEALEDKKFVAGEQWDPMVLEQRKGLPCLKINTMPQFTAQLVGDWRENRIAVKVLPAEGGDKDVADTRSDLIRAIETKSQADRILNDSFESMVQCGDGAFKVAVNYTSDDVFDQDIIIQPIDDALSVVWDRLSVDPTGRDARHCFVDDVIPLDEFNKNWPDADPSTLSTKDRREFMATGWLETNTARVTEHWRIIERKRLLVMFKDNTLYAFDEDKPEEYDAAIEKHGKPVKTRIAPCRYAQMHVVTGFKILAGPYEWKLSRLPVIRMSGRTVSIGDRRIRYGLVRFMKDSARLRNFFRSVAAEQLGYAPKAQWIAPESAVEGREDQFRKAHLTRDPLLVYNDGAEVAPERVEPPAIQAALLNEAQINTQDMKDITGIHDASLGIKSNETSGRAIMARQREGDVASLTYYDNGNAAVLEAGDVINQLIPQIYDGTRIVRIIGEDESAKLVSINDPMDPASPNLAVGKYDVAITTGASYTTRRVEAAEAMMDAIQVYPEMMQIAGDLVVKAQDWPGAEELSARLQKTIPPQYLSDKEKAEMGNQGPDAQALMAQSAQTQEALQTAQQQLQQLQQENFSLKMKAEIEAKKLEIDEYKAETDRLTAYAALLKDNASLSLQQLETEADQALEAAESEHERMMDVATLAQQNLHQQQNRQDTADQAAQSNALQAQALQAKAAGSNASSGEQTSTPSAD
jgi:hypothetical protein